MVALSFVLLATASTFGMAKSDTIVRRAIPWLKRRGLRDLDAGHGTDYGLTGHKHGARILLLGFFRTASSLLEELERTDPTLLEQLAVVDFNPQVHAGLRARGVQVIYGDISQRDTLVHAGIERAEILVCTVPDSLLKGTTNHRLVRQLRELNPTAQIIATAEVLDEVPVLGEAGANYVSVARLDEAAQLHDALKAATAGLLDQKRAQLAAKLAHRDEILP
jgi:voltage-gated potassium channel Kch